MWTSTNFKTYQKQFDFTSSEQGKPTYTALKIDEIDFINIVEGLEGEIDENQIFQTILCDQCGFYECATGNWVALRQLNDIIFFIPAFDFLKTEIDEGIYEPPYIFKQKGAYWLTITEFKEFKKLVREIDKIHNIKSMTNFEIISLYKWDTPNKMFGKFPNFEPVKKNHILTTSVLDNESIIEIIERKLNELEKAKDFYLEPLVYEDSIISVYLDNHSTTEWKAVYKSEEDYDLLLGGEFRIITT
jgi:hypothetical protein